MHCICLVHLHNCHHVHLRGSNIALSVCISLPLTAVLFQLCIMWTELQRSGVFDEVVQWRTLSTFLETLTFVSACWRFFFPELNQFTNYPHLDVVLEVLTLVRIALQIPMTAVSHTQHAVANRYEIHRCRMTAYLLVCFLQRPISQDNGCIPPFFDVLHCAIPIQIRLPTFSVWVQESKWQYTLRPHLNAPWVHRLLRKVGFREHLVDFRRHSLSSPTSLSLHKRFRRRLRPNLHRQLRPAVLDDIQAHYSALYQLGSNTGASFQTMRGLLSAFPPTQLYYFLRLATFVNEPFRSKAQKLLAQVLHKRKLQAPATLTQLLLPPLHARDWKAKLGTWLQRWVASNRNLFPSLFLPKIRVVETRSATLGDRIYNYRKWQQRWTPDTSFPCCCIDVDDCTTFRAHSHAVVLNEFQCINADIDADIMSASMKDQYVGDVDKLQQRFTLQLRKLARRWKVQGSSFDADSRPILFELFDEHRCNVQDQAHWTSESLQPFCPYYVGCHPCGSFPFACSRDLPSLPPPFAPKS